uniref:Uncharacterized protein n=1 Tax=Rhizophora mucronata TaxID=61149 RepID=A0A2P2LQV7_RHIMU
MFFPFHILRGLQCQTNKSMATTPATIHMHVPLTTMLINH